VGHTRYLRSLLFSSIVAGSLTLGASQARADEPTPADRATARTLAQEGYVALRDKKYAVAADRFARALALVHAPTLLRDLARAQVGLGKLVDAHENYSRIIREGVARDAPQPWQQALADAKAEVVSIPPRLPWITITVTGPSEPTVTIDGVPIAAASLGVKRPADPGRHEIRASAPGYYTAKKTLTLEEGETGSITLELEEAPPDAPPQPEEPPPQHAIVESEPAWRKPAIITAFAVSGAGIAFGSVAGIMAMSKHNKLESTCGKCDLPQDEERVRNFRTTATLSTIGFAVGGFGAVTGLVLLFVQPQAAAGSTGKAASQQARSGLQWSPVVGLNNVGVEGTF
jgi:PEGA domain